MESGRPRVTIQGLKLLNVLVDEAPKELSGAELMRKTALASGTIYPILSKYEKAGWLKARWEKVDPSEVGRPRRRLYCLTEEGIAVQRFEAGRLLGGGLVWST